MQIRFLHSFLGAITLILCATQSLPAQEPPKPRAKSPAAAAKAPAPPRTKGKLKPVDINSATKEEISFMLGLDVALAARIVAGRPYPTKARLLTNKVVSAEVYASIKDRVIAKQRSTPR
ncbi:MAG: helix-hairpin-helix domain-containing protein [Geothrix sp.]|nr:helix-hairpin-helix domain-containing protein [Geothrix sp.]